MQVPVNYLAVILAAIAGMCIGFIWYGPVLFGRVWMKEMGYTDKSLAKAKKNMGGMYALSLLGSLFMAYILSHVITFSMSYFGYAPVPTGLTTAFWMWLGFVAPVQMTEVLFGGKSWQLYKINTFYQLTSLLAMGWVLGAMM